MGKKTITGMLEWSRPGDLERMHMEATTWPNLWRGSITELDFLAKLFSSIYLNFYSVVMSVAIWAPPQTNPSMKVTFV